jgi:hypothetical protein
MKIKWLAGLLLLTVLISGCTQNGGSSGNSTVQTQVTISQPGVSNSTLEAQDAEFALYLTKYKQKRIFSGNYSVPDRASYGISKMVFANLPPVPTDFLYKVYLIKYGRFVDIASLGPEYYKQPEFDPEFTRFGLKYWEEWKAVNYSKRHWGTVGFRTYPFSQHVVAKPGNSFNITMFLSSDWNVETYQGISLTTGWLPWAVSEDGKTMNATDNSGKYISVNVTPNEFILTPAFPQFTEEWVKKLTFSGKVSETTPPGLYILTVRINKPSQVNSDKWLLEYLNLYSEGAGMVSTDKPYLQAFINVQQ